MVAYLEEALKSKLEGFEGQERASKLFTMSSISKDQIRNNLEEKMDKYGRKDTLLLTVALPLPSPIGFCWGITEIFNQEFNGYFKSFNHRLDRRVLQEKKKDRIKISLKPLPPFQVYPNQAKMGKKKLEE
ncbi:hypothetical protein M9H77_02239 [Catharanthus roseus]|uniref:Uncharacterized protein n=1 Tax=Catharanthus roseus TaxID=4058 RepID=A0ACC0C850_CATRO|nr:hypothetical protein M9H77_02239 [Catharanthus roseus]